MNELSVLVVEDEPSFAEALIVGLGREGFAITVSSDGADALRRVDEIHPDLVLLDVMLPTMSGIDVCWALRLKSRVPIIMVTAKGSEVDTVVGLEVGADDYVTRPYRLSELVARMRTVLRRSDSRLVVVADGVDLPGEWRRFELFEALHGHRARDRRNRTTRRGGN
jgi:two-component system response regulator RegX3